MKKWIALTAGVAALALATIVWAQPGGPECGDRGPDRMKRGGPEQALQALLRSPEAAAEAGVSEEQLTQLRDLMHDLEKQTIQAQADQKIAALELRRLMQADTPDRAAIMAAVEEGGRLRTEMQKLKVERMLSVRETLGPDAVKKLREQARERRKEMRARMSDMPRRGADRARGPEGQSRGDRGSQGKRRGGEGPPEGPPWMGDPMPPPPSE
jgi:Spy/CpxP family protein refolding chaperone